MFLIGVISQLPSEQFSMKTQVQCHTEEISVDIFQCKIFSLMRMKSGMLALRSIYRDINLSYQSQHSITECLNKTRTSFASKKSLQILLFFQQRVTLHWVIAWFPRVTPEHEIFCGERLSVKGGGRDVRAFQDEEKVCFDWSINPAWLKFNIVIFYCFLLPVLNISSQAL